MYTINWLKLILITVLNFVIFIQFYLREKNTNRKMMYIFITISFFIYSGVGMGYNEIDGSYIYQYSIFLFLVLSALSFTLKLINKKKHQDSSTDNNDNWMDTIFLRYRKIYLILSIFFIMTLFINLIIPTVRINQLWNPPRASLVDIFAQRQVHNANPLLNLADMLGALLMPFFFMYLYCLREKGKKIKIFIWVFFWVLLEYLKFGYLGRNEMAVYVIFIYLAFFTSSKKSGKSMRKQLIIAICGMLLAVPFFLNYEAIRLGAASSSMSFREAFIQLFQNETYYPKFYSDILYYNWTVNPMDYISWLVCLPIPSAIWASKPSIDINAIFTAVITGKSIGQAGYSVVLPSLLGEAFVIWGMKFYWIHAVITGAILGAFFKFYEKYKIFSIIYIYYIVLLLIVGRGGSQYYISSLINGTISVVAFTLLIYLTHRRRKLRRV